VREHFLWSSRSIVIAGTHGKTTTTSLTGWLLVHGGRDPSILVGGIARNLGEDGSSYRLGKGKDFVIEGDEYDSAYFDKTAKFLKYLPDIAVINNVEFDHADIYTDVEHVKSSFRKLAGILPVNGPLIGCTDYPHLLAAIDRAGRYRFVPYGLRSPEGWEPRSIAVGPEGSRFELFWKGRRDTQLKLSLVGAMNVLNATAVYAICREFGIELGAVAEGLATYKGAARRQEIVGELDGVTVVDDFAHHPTAVGLTISAIRGRFPGRRLWAIFEPRSNTSRRAIFQQAYAEALGGADVVALSAVFRKDNDPLKPEEMLSTDRLIADLSKRGIPAWTEAGPDEILARLKPELRSGDVVLCMSNGAFGGLPRKLLAEK
jgi:UDP-N-acetylmuramate: L-alanyl-gamma-D-glutamyl-meso-diaminopimelate ligase